MATLVLTFEIHLSMATTHCIDVQLARASSNAFVDLSALFNGTEIEEEEDGMDDDIDCCICGRGSVEVFDTGKLESANFVSTSCGISIAAGGFKSVIKFSSLGTVNVGSLCTDTSLISVPLFTFNTRVKEHTIYEIKI